MFASSRITQRGVILREKLGVHGILKGCKEGILAFILIWTMRPVLQVLRRSRDFPSSDPRHVST